MLILTGAEQRHDDDRCHNGKHGQHTELNSAKVFFRRQFKTKHGERREHVTDAVADQAARGHFPDVHADLRGHRL